MTLNEVFPNKFCINLLKRPDRWYQASNEFSKYSIENVCQFIGFDGDSIKDKSDILKPGELGILKTQKSLYHHCISSNIDSALIFEDDVQFYDDIINFEYYYNQVPDDWQILFLGGNHLCGTLTQVSDNIFKTTHSRATHSYAIKRKAMEYILRISKEENAQSDVYVGNACMMLPSYVILPVLAIQRESYSNIENMDKNYTCLH